MLCYDYDYDYDYVMLCHVMSCHIIPYHIISYKFGHINQLLHNMFVIFFIKSLKLVVDTFL